MSNSFSNSNTVKKVQLPRTGFTLIELLTSIAIIGILAAILIPVVGTVRHSARSSQSLSNLRQIGTAAVLYTTDNNGNFPLLDGQERRWPAELEDYMGTDRGKSSFSDRRNPVYIDLTVPADKRNQISDYGASIMVFITRAIANRDNRGPFNISLLVDPSKIAIVGTSYIPNTGQAQWQLRTGGVADGFITGRTPGQGAPDPRLGSGNVGLVFADGHVEAIPRDLVYSDDNRERRALFDPSYYY
jgi:prepilin-type N-terminal cleavage/methylation domain-containing protein/prepilin-type processing-associated H-X9-DG protein